MIELVTTPNAIFNTVVTGGMLVFGAWVLTLTPRTRATKLLGAFALAAGALYAPDNLTSWSGWELYAIWIPYTTVAASIGGVALLALARLLLEPLGERGSRVWRATVAIVVAFTLVGPALVLSSDGAVTGLEGWRLLSAVAGFMGSQLFFSAFLAVGLGLAWMYRYPLAEDQEAVRVRVALVSAALGIWPAFQAGANVTGLAEPTLRAWQIVTVAGAFTGWLVVAGLWLANTYAVPGDSRRARNVALVLLGALFLGMVNRVFVEPFFAPADDPLFDLVRLTTVVLLGYGILRHQLLGIDAKFRWGVSKTTVAGVFVAVFFVVSEGAQVVFAGFAGSEFLGVLAAGALVFFLAPIQRAADDLAEAVVPGTGPGGTPEDRYREAVQAALADGEVTEDEERHLVERQEELGLSPTRAYEVRRQVEDETGGGGEEA